MRIYGLSDIGKRRSTNQDTFRYWISEDKNEAIAAVCDGMGGERSGDLAATLGAETFMDECLNGYSNCRQRPAEIILNAVEKANQRIYMRAASDVDCFGMGTTLVGTWISGNIVEVINIGDSRCYLYHNEKIRQITKDHSYVQKLVDRGIITEEEAANHPDRNLITKALGFEGTVGCDLFPLETDEGDALLLCSDGLTRVVGVSDIESAFMSFNNPKDIAEKLVNLALVQNTGDNVTVLVVCGLPAVHEEDIHE